MHREMSIADIDLPSRFSIFICRFARLIPAMGILPEEEGREWVDHMVRSHDDGTFFASGAFYTYHAAKC